MHKGAFLCIVSFVYLPAVFIDLQNALYSLQMTASYSSLHLQDFYDVDPIQRLDQ